MYPERIHKVQIEYQKGIDFINLSQVAEQLGIEFVGLDFENVGVLICIIIIIIYFYKKPQMP